MICDDGHEEVVYVSASRNAKCPVCEANKKISELEDRISELEQEKAEAADSHDSSQSS